MSDDKPTKPHRVVKHADEALARYHQRNAESPIRRWMIVVAIPMLLTGSCWAGTEINIHIPEVGHLSWMGEEEGEP